MTSGERAAVYFMTTLLLVICAGVWWGPLAAIATLALILHLLVLVHVVVRNVVRGVMRAMHMHNGRGI